MYDEEILTTYMLRLEKLDPDGDKYRRVKNELDDYCWENRNQRGNYDDQWML